MISPDIPAPHLSLVAASFKSHFWPSPLPSICTMPKASKSKKARQDNLSKATAALTLKRSQTIPQLFILRFSNRAARFVSAYYLGCTGKDLGYLQKTYKSHRMLPYDAVTLMEESVHM
ncbi:hypothetical protein B0H10DRAFT_2057515 [Mycena sp. CBHHK59/15]|nr:hypothetical protein B0H10DRAFT_2057515 [Mycena sp. CBHHK59/15]